MAGGETSGVSLAGAAAVSRLGEKARFKSAIREILTQFNIPISRRFVGAKPGTVLEHDTRRHFVDPFLQALGWDLTQFSEEVIEEARTRGETTLRLDYLGVNQQTRVPVLIVEAKAWSAPFVRRSAKQESLEGKQRDSPISLICAAIEHFKSGGHAKDSPVTVEWSGYLRKLFQYVESIQTESKHAVTRAAIVSGQWLVVFLDPTASFLSSDPVSDLHINVYRGSDLVTESDSIFDCLERKGISDAFPPRIRPSLLPAYVRSTDVKRAYRAMWVSRTRIGARWRPEPHLALYSVVVVERRDGMLLTAVDDSLPRISIPHNYNELRKHISAVEEQSDELLKRVNCELGSTLVPSDVAEFPGFPAHNVESVLDVGGNNRRVDLIKSDRQPGEFVLVIGVAKHFLLKAPSVDSCMYHGWNSCRISAQARGETPIVTRSVMPQSFFMSDEGHHCAHRLVHDRREARCQIDAFEEFLCCRACALQDFCWSAQELSQLPCGTGPQAAAV